MPGEAKELRHPTLRVSELLHRSIADGTLVSNRLTIARHQHIYQCGQPNRYLYLVEAGCVKTVVHSINGKECLLDIHPTGDIFGESGLVHPERFDSAIAMATTTVRAIPLRSVLDALAAAGGLDAMVHHLLECSTRQQQNISDFVTHDSEHRLAAQLINLGNKLGSKGNPFTHIDEKITHEDLACMVGTTRSRIGYFLKRFRELEMITVCKNRHLVIHENRLTSYLMADS